MYQIIQIINCLQFQKIVELIRAMIIKQSNDYKIYKRLYNNNKLINNNVSKFLYQASSSNYNKNIINHNKI